MQVCFLTHFRGECSQVQVAVLIVVVMVSWCWRRTGRVNMIEKKTGIDTMFSP